MKTKEELYKWFFNKFDNCYLVEDVESKDNYYMYYDKQFIRQKKLATILDEEIIYPEKPTGISLFRQDWNNEWLLCDYDEIWSYLEENYSSNYSEVKDLIIWMLEQHDKLKILTPYHISSYATPLLEQHDKLKILTPIKRLLF